MDKKPLMENNISVEAKDGQVEVLTGASYHDLLDETTCTYKTNTIKSFLDFISNLNSAKGEEHPGFSIYYNEGELKVFENIVERNTAPVAVCSLEESRILEAIYNNVNTSINLNAFEKFLWSFKNYLDTDGVDLLDLVQNFKVAKTTKITRQKDKKGNYTFTVMRESAGKEDVNFPDTITIKSFPVFLHHPDEMDLTFEIYFDYAQHDESVAVYFELQHNEIDDVVQKRKIEILLEYLTGAEFKDIKHHWGSLQIDQKSDEWKYKTNPVTIDTN